MVFHKSSIAMVLHLSACQYLRKEQGISHHHYSCFFFVIVTINFLYN